MPKDRRDRSVSLDRCRASPFPCSSSIAKRPLSKVPSEAEANIKEWEEAVCPVCMEHPHNAVLLICTSHKKGCRPYMCDTSYRHSNCLDQFRKSFSTKPSTARTTPQQEQSHLVREYPSFNILQEEEPLLGSGTFPQQELSPLANANLSRDIPQLEQSPFTSMSAPTESATTMLQEEFVGSPSENPAEPKLLCPLCRGQVKEWIVVEEARNFMNRKTRSCACETCAYTGTYMDLRKHARIEHPLARPTEADPERQLNWRRLERQRDLGDFLSTLQSSFEEEGGSEDSILTMDGRGWLTVFFLVRVFRPDSSASNNVSWSGTSRERAYPSFVRMSTRLWGESYDGEAITFSTEDGNESSGGGLVPWGRLRRRRRTTIEDRPTRSA